MIRNPAIDNITTSQEKKVNNNETTSVPQKEKTEVEWKTNKLRRTRERSEKKEKEAEACPESRKKIKKTMENVEKAEKEAEERKEGEEEKKIGFKAPVHVKKAEAYTA